MHTPILAPHPILYANDGYLSHQVRLVLLEKQVEFEGHFLQSIGDDEDIADLNPYHTLPVLLHRELVLYHNATIFEYLEERYQQYRLLPLAPNARANYRQLIWRINQDWMALAHVLLTHADSFEPPKADLARQDLTTSLITLSPLFAHQVFFLSDSFGLCDCILASLLYRLPQMQIELPYHLTRPLHQYMQRVFERPSFQQSLSFDRPRRHR